MPLNIRQAFKRNALRAARWKHREKAGNGDEEEEREKEESYQRKKVTLQDSTVSVQSCEETRGAKSRGGEREEAAWMASTQSLAGTLSLQRAQVQDQGLGSRA
eukprot:615739-Rhodomonas_salina.2